MSNFDVAAAFANQSYDLQSISELEVLFADAVSELGFRYYALVHHVDLSAPPGEAIKLDNYPKSWFNEIVKNKYFIDDPIFQTAQRVVSGFKWSDVPKFIDMSSRQKQILSDAQKHDLGDGFSVPVCIPGEFSGSCSFGVSSTKDLKDDALPCAQFLAAYAFEAARRLKRNRYDDSMGTWARRLHLTDRQLECTVLVGRGKSDWEIGKLLDISPETAHKHVEAAKSKLSVASRQQLIGSALYHGHITYADLFGL